MEVILPPDLKQFLSDQVGAGHFSTTDEVICEALRLLQRQEDLDRLKHEELRRLVAVGLAQAERGEVAPLDMATIRAEARRRLAERKNGDNSDASGVTNNSGAPGSA